VSFPTGTFGFLSLLVSAVQLSAGWSARCAKIRELGRVADLGYVPRFRADAERGLLLNDSADGCWPKGNRVTALCDGNVVLSSVLAEEEPFFTLQQGCEVQAAYRHVDL
jgi:hypothetical protein